MTISFAAAPQSGNPEPVAENDVGMTSADSAVTLDLLADDSHTDGGTLSSATLGTATNGSALANNDGTKFAGISACINAALYRPPSNKRALMPESATSHPKATRRRLRV